MLCETVESSWWWWSRRLAMGYDSKASQSVSTGLYTKVVKVQTPTITESCRIMKGPGELGRSDTANKRRNNQQDWCEEGRCFAQCV